MKRTMGENNYPEYGKVYRLWRGGVFLGEAMFMEDPNIGDSFMRSVSIDGMEAFEVVIADVWQEVKPEDDDNKKWN